MVYFPAHTPAWPDRFSASSLAAAVQARRVGGPRSLAGERLDIQGFDTLRWRPTPEGPLVSGMAIGQVGPVSWNGQWTALFETSHRLISLDVVGEADGRPIEVSLRRGDDDRWRVNGKPRPDLDGCDGIALDIAPALTALTAKRLGLGSGPKRSHRPLIEVGFVAADAQRAVQAFQSETAADGTATLRWWPSGRKDALAIRYRRDGWPVEICGLWRER